MSVCLALDVALQSKKPLVFNCNECCCVILLVLTADIPPSSFLGQCGF